MSTVQSATMNAPTICCLCLHLPVFEGSSGSAKLALQVMRSQYAASPPVLTPGLPSPLQPAPVGQQAGRHPGHGRGRGRGRGQR